MILVYSETTLRCSELAMCQCKRHLSFQHSKPERLSKFFVELKKKNFFLPFKCWQPDAIISSSVINPVIVKRCLCSGYSFLHVELILNLYETIHIVYPVLLKEITTFKTGCMF